MEYGDMLMLLRIGLMAHSASSALIGCSDQPISVLLSHRSVRAACMGEKEDHICEMKHAQSSAHCVQRIVIEFRRQVMIILKYDNFNLSK